MAEIYRALSNLSMKWKIINTYHLRTKYEYAEGFEVKIELQLYRLDIDNYLVDFKYVGQQSAEELATRAEFLKSINEQSRADSRSRTNSASGTVHLSDGVTGSTASVGGVGHVVSGPQDIPYVNGESSATGDDTHMMTAPALEGHSLLPGTVHFQTLGHSLGTAEGVSNHLMGTSVSTSTTGPRIL